MSDSELVPPGWQEKRLREVAEINPPVDQVPDSDIEVSFVPMEDVSEDARIVGNRTRPYREVATGYTAFQQGDILIAKITPCFENGKGALAQDLVNGIGFGSTEFHVVRAKTGVDSEFLRHLTLSHRFRGHGELNMQGSAGQKRVPADFIRSYLFLCPPLREQRRIAEILGTWDEGIVLVEQRIEAARQRKKALMQRLLNGRVRFPEFAGREWHTVKLGEVFDERRERGSGDLPLLSVTDDEGIIYRDELDRRDTSSSDKSGYLRVCEGDIAYNTMRMWQGRSGVSEYEGIVSPAYTVCEPKPAIDVDFAGYLFQLPSVVYKFRRYSQGMVSDTWTLRFDNFAAIEVQIPGLQEQKRIATVMQTCDREIELLEQKRDALQRQKKGMMQRLLTGRVRVSV